MLIRKIVTDDNSAMAGIIRNSLSEFNAAKPGTVFFDPATDHLSELFTQNKSAYFVIEVNGEIAGGSGFFPTEGLYEDTCEMVKMYVSNKFRGKGFGQTLLEKCMEEAMKAGYKKMYLESMPELKNALAMYEKNGFHYIPAQLGNSGHCGCDLFMMKDLNDN